MADHSLSSLPSIEQVDGDELLYIVDNPGSTPSSKSITVTELFSNASSILTLSVETTDLILNERETPTSSSDSNILNGRIFFDENYLYIKVNINTIKRVALSTF